jgi:hypothetical protein
MLRRFRSAITGRFVTRGHAEADPAGTVAETNDAGRYRRALEQIVATTGELHTLQRAQDALKRRQPR